MANRVVITGMGAVTPLGNEIETLWENLLAGKSGVRLIDRFDTEEFSSKIAGLVNDFSIEGYIDAKDARRMDQFVQYGLVASCKAIEDAKLNIDESNAHRVGVVVGSGIGGMQTLCDQHSILVEKGPRRLSPLFIPMMIPNILAGQISIYTGAKGPNFCVVTACATATHSIGEAFKTIQRGQADIIISGGAEAPVIPLGVGGFTAMKALSTRNDEPQKASRPFDRDRDGFVIGEGAGILVLEELEHALKRGAKIYGEVVGYGASGDAYHITAPEDNGSGAVRAMRAAIKDAGIEPEDVGYINAHGTSTELNDVIESRAIKTLFGAHAKKLLVNSTKSMTGHLLGAAGAVEGIVTALSLQKGLFHQTMNLENPDEECDLNYIPGKNAEADITYGLSNSFGFGGHNGVLLFKRYEE